MVWIDYRVRAGQPRLCWPVGSRCAPICVGDCRRSETAVRARQKSGPGHLHPGAESSAAVSHSGSRDVSRLIESCLVQAERTVRYRRRTQEVAVDAAEAYLRTDVACGSAACGVCRPASPNLSRCGPTAAAFDRSSLL